MSQTDLMSAVNQIAAERDIDPTAVIEAIKSAIISGFRKDYPEEEQTMLEVEIDPQIGTIRVFANKKVVDEVTTAATQISEADAKRLEPKLRKGDHVLVDITPTGDFGRVAAQSARQVILQKIREFEKEAIMVEFKDKIGEIEYGVVQRLDGDSVVWEIHRAIAIMPNEDRIVNEFYKSGSKLKILLKEIRMTPRGKQLIVSRSDPKFLEALFKLEVPEIVSGSVEIKSIAREAGSRSKVAVFSSVDGIDPIGSCVGQKGVRINAIINELKFRVHEEKIDIILWDEDIATFIANALSPAQVKKVEIIDQKNKEARVIVPDDQLSLAIGKEGQNVRLAAKLTGWNIDIQGETIKVEDPNPKKAKVQEAETEKTETKTKAKAKSKKTTKSKSSELAELGLSARVVATLEKNKITTVAKLKKAIKSGEKIAGLGDKSLDEIKTKLA